MQCRDTNKNIEFGVHVYTADIECIVYTFRWKPTTKTSKPLLS